ncbi:hypothetical protein B9Q17_07370 [Marinobacter vinifirmus]|uniref:MSHA biogenesis protein MshQ n=1 Tax=Marinobacter vinifirmus TaxID=355591 RepID=A0A7Z1DT19_9GAMM|nr:DUF6701 domain-containing protein [Marinobacter vinifirmus]OZC35488.1 hypothetical protein B9Q17_07370 [Marinobacter vinifirmus]
MRYAKIFLLLLSVAFSPQSLAVVCTNVFQANDGENAGLTGGDEQLDLSGVPWSSTGDLPDGPLGSGDYYVGDGSYDPIVLLPEAKVRIFVDGDLTLGNNARINANGDASKLLIVVRGDIDVGNGAIISGLLYATGDIDIGQGQGGGSLPDITGGLAAAGEIDLPRRAQVAVDYTGIDDGLLTELCVFPVELRANGIRGPVVEVQVGEEVEVTAIAEQCPIAASPPFSDRWVDRWYLNDQVIGGYRGDLSPCERAPVFLDSREFQSEGDYIYRYETEYCDSFFCFGDREPFEIAELIVRVVAADAAIDHYEIKHDGVALTCQPETIEIRACANSTCTELVPDISAVSLAPSSGWIGGNTVALEAGKGSATIQITDFEGEVFSAFLGVTGSTPSVQPQPETLCKVGGSLSAENCELLFFKSGLAFDVPPLISHRPSGPFQLRAVRQDDDTQACVSAFEGSVEKVVRFSSAYLDPNGDNRTNKRPVSVNGKEVSLDSNSPTGLTLSFDDQGVAEIDVSYLDAGEVQLSALYLGSEATGDDGLVMPGVDSFVAVPAGFCVTSAGDCSAGDSSCPPFRKAGESFDLSIQAVGWQSDADSDFCIGNPTTPNFMLPDIPLQLELVEPNEVGAVPGTLPEGAESYVHSRSSDATEVVSLSQSEVGVFRFRTAPEPGAYLERDLPPAVSQPIGRFYPDRFRVTVEDGELGGECEPDAFVYTGQEFGWKLAASALIEPLSIQGEVTKNYTFDGFRSLFEDDITRSGPEELVALNNDDEPMKLGSDMKGAALTVSSPGQLEYRYHSEDKFWFEKTPAARRAPFYPKVQFALSDIEDGDGVRSELPRNDIRPEMPAEVRYGRLVMENVYGPENLEPPAVLRMPFEVEVFDGDRFDRHSDDSCNSWNADGVNVVEAPARHTLKPDSGTFVDGKGEPLSISPTGERGTDVLEWSVSTWLQDFWGREPENPGEPAEGELQNPRATATFGVYRGNDRIIYWREVPAN